MMPNSDLAKGIVQSLSCLLKDDKLADFTVKVEQTYFRCHRFILGACSRFFYAMFTSDMKEKNDNTAQLHEIDLSAFELILKVLYTGEDVVNNNNVVSIWQTAHRLQIQFLVAHCETFLVSVLSLENYAEFYRMARMLDSKPVLRGVKQFVLKNYILVKEDESFLELSAEELIELIQSDALNVTSEDDVLLSIFKWIESSPNKNETNNYESKDVSMQTNSMFNDPVKDSNAEIHPNIQNNSSFSTKDNSGLILNGCKSHTSRQNRTVHLKSLLTASRSCLASLSCLKTLYHHHLTQSDEGANNIFFNAILYQGKGNRHGYYPTAAMHRSCSDFEHVGVIAYDSGNFFARSFARNKWYSMPTGREIKNKIKITVFDSSIYAVGPADNTSSKLCVLNESSWVSIAELSGLKYFLLSHEHFLYVFNSLDGKILRMQPNSHDKSLKNLSHPEDITHVEFALSFNEYILVFSKDSHDGKEETAVHAMNSRNKTWRRVKNLDGPANKMTSFQDCDKVYLLQSNGNLWSLSIDNELMIAFHFLKKLWDVKESLRGAVLYKGKLFFFRKLSLANPDGKILTSLPGVYNSFQYWKKMAMHPTLSARSCTKKT